MTRALMVGLGSISLLVVAGLAISSGTVSDKARKLHFSSIVVDTHDDTTQRFLGGKFDIGERAPDGSIDIPRMKEGGLGAIFFSVWIPSKVTGPEAVDRALEQIDAVREQVRRHPREHGSGDHRGRNSRGAQERANRRAHWRRRRTHDQQRPRGVAKLRRAGRALHDADAQRQ